MAYVIGSKKGKDIAEGMKAGETYKASDGSTWKKNTDGSVSVTTDKGETFNNAYTPTTNSTKTTTKSGNSQYTYTPTGTYNDAGLPDYAKTQIDALKTDYNNAIAAGDKDAALKAHNDAEAIRAQYGYSGGLDGSEYNELGVPIETTQPTFDWLDNNPQPTHTSKYDPQIDALLNEILTRDDFSYDASKDPLYQQYANMYQREGDRAMRDTLAEAAASAGGMNTYAITAAQQAANYYNSQLGDKIPELYQLAYEMYLADKESMVQDLGLLQNMDATQYARYRDTMSDWKDDRNFAYGMYQDALNQNNWQTQFDYNSMWDNRNFLNSNEWANKEFNANQTQLGIENERYDQETAKEEVWAWIEEGIMPSADLINKAGMDSATVEAYVAAKKAEKEPKKIDDDDDLIVRGGNPNYVEVVDSMREKCDKAYNNGGFPAVQTILKEAVENGDLDQSTYMKMFNEYRDKSTEESDADAYATYLNNEVQKGNLTEEQAAELYARRMNGEKVPLNVTPLS